MQNKKNQNKIWKLTAQKIERELTDEEESELESLQPEGLVIDQVMQELSGLKMKVKIDEQILDQAQDNSWSRIASEISVESDLNKKARRWKILSIAVSLIFLMVCGSLFLLKKQESISAEMIIAGSAYGEIRKIELPDGSLVWLNAGSQLIYPEQFAPDNREVYVMGEAYFDVVKDKSRPFIVKSDMVAVKVLGTRFNIRSYPEDEESEITLESGSVGFDKVNNKFANILYLVPDQRAAISKKTGNVTIENVSSSNFTGWKERKLRFKSEPFADIVTDLERTFNVSIEVRSEKLKNEVYTGKFESGENLDQILNLIKLNTRMKYTRNNSNYIISEK